MKHGKSLPTPAGARRVTKPDKTRVWVLDGMEFKSKRELYVYFSPEARMEREKDANLTMLVNENASDSANAGVPSTDKGLPQTAGEL